MSRLLSSYFLPILLAAPNSLSANYDPTSQAVWTIHIRQIEYINPLDRTDDIQEQRKEIQTAIKLSSGSGALTASLSRFRINKHMGEAEIDPIGTDAMDKVKFHIPWANTGAATRPIPTDDMDATSWPAVEPTAELLAQVLQICLPRLPEQKLQPGSVWSTELDMKAALDGAPGVIIKTYLFFTIGDIRTCQGGTCVSVAQILHISSFQRRSMGNSILGIDMDATGLATSIVRMEDHSLLSTRGSISMESDTTSHVSLGMPPTYAMHTIRKTTFEFYPSEEFNIRR